MKKSIHNFKYLVSIITPCYNGEKTIGRLIDSILNQTYKNIEHIIIDDGSNDNTKYVIDSYREQYLKNNIKLIYRYQNNLGAAGAVNNGLKLFSGDFLCWIDADDFLLPDSIYKRLKFLIENPSYGSVSSDAYVVYENNIDRPIGFVNNYIKRATPNQFKYLLMRQSCFCCICHMVRSEYFINTNPNREIYCSTEGQNYQMLLPIYYRYPHGIIDIPLSTYVINSDSHSHKKRTETQLHNRLYELENIIYETFKRMDMSKAEKDKYAKIVKFYFTEEHLKLYIKHKDFKDSIKFYNKLKKIYKNKFIIFTLAKDFLKIPFIRLHNKICTKIKFIKQS